MSEDTPKVFHHFTLSVETRIPMKSKDLVDAINLLDFGPFFDDAYCAEVRVGKINMTTIRVETKETYAQPKPVKPRKKKAKVEAPAKLGTHGLVLIPAGKPPAACKVFETKELAEEQLDKLKDVPAKSFYLVTVK